MSPIDNMLAFQKNYIFSGGKWCPSVKVTINQFTQCEVTRSPGPFGQMVRGGNGSSVVVGITHVSFEYELALALRSKAKGIITKMISAGNIAIVSSCNVLAT